MRFGSLGLVKEPSKGFWRTSLTITMSRSIMSASTDRSPLRSADVTPLLIECFHTPPPPHPPTVPPPPAGTFVCDSYGMV